MARDPSAVRSERASTAPSGASDISVYGASPIALGVPALAMTMGGVPSAAAERGNADSAPSEAPSPVSSGNAALADSGSPFTAALLAPVVLAEAAIASVALLTPVGQPAQEAVPELPAPTTAISGGSGTPPAILPPPTAVPTEMAPGALGPASGPNVAAAPDTPEGQVIAASVQPDTDAAMDAMGARIDAIDDAVADIQDRVDTVGDALADSVATTIGIAQDRVADISATLNDTRADIVTAVDARTAGAASAVEDVITTAGARVADATDMLADITGSDPAGGITTLVSMVSAADAFGLQDIGGGTDALVLPDIGGGDPFGDFAPADLLLTVTDSHDGAFGLLADLADG